MNKDTRLHVHKLTKKVQKKEENIQKKKKKIFNNSVVIKIQAEMR